MTLTDCQIFMTVSQLGTFAAAAEQMHLTPSAISHAVSGMESECGFLLFTRTKSGVTMTAAAESLLPSIILIPGISGNTGAGIENVKKSVEQAVGSDILFSNN